MIVADTSALLTILFDEPGAARCRRALEIEPDIHMSAGTLAEALIILAHRGGSELLLALVEELGFTVDPVNAAFAERVGQAHGRWGKGAHAAQLNFGDCFAYVLAKELDCPLLFVGEDFARTDVESALS
ncbi:type II toxin-antitoxin system VapC family toxin [Sphingosinicella ginsenosidimutans]|uniref:Ribonuclease VapC n=1 Tax=Allosphingosinicella ginsenosidimutans TaxID=1176539 RepID=A0A5C6TRC6_9SPHN|nr:type II toxin-antitoxin system VapC family toxin [Sphingosinicella ginsenosidimutans]TXC62495.1 type II toxin-antitoxin system VapC family toxin [Sphingosinicella ginsenosidimutans]